MTTTEALLEANAALKQVVQARLARKQFEEESHPVLSEDSESSDWPDPIHESSQAFVDLLARLKEMHLSKSRDYGSAHDPLANIRNGAEFVGIEPWRAAMVRLSDKVTRLATFNRTGRLEYEGVEDTLLDLASYALLALVLFADERG